MNRRIDRRRCAEGSRNLLLKALLLRDWLNLSSRRRDSDELKREEARDEVKEEAVWDWGARIGPECGRTLGREARLGANREHETEELEEEGSRESSISDWCRVWENCGNRCSRS